MEPFSFTLHFSQKVIETCERELWDGAWYLRGITADGRKIGCQADREGRDSPRQMPWAPTCSAEKSRIFFRCS